MRSNPFLSRLLGAVALVVVFSIGASWAQAAVLTEPVLINFRGNHDDVSDPNNTWNEFQNASTSGDIHGTQFLQNLVTRSGVATGIDFRQLTHNGGADSVGPNEARITSAGMTWDPDMLPYHYTATETFIAVRNDYTGPSVDRNADYTDFRVEGLTPGVLYTFTIFGSIWPGSEATNRFADYHVFGADGTDSYLGLNSYRNLDTVTLSGTADLDGYIVLRVAISEGSARAYLNTLEIIPEPASLGLLALGGLFMLRRRAVARV